MRRLVSSTSRAISSSSIHPINLFLDFDGTLTEKDTLHLIGNAGLDVQTRHGRSPPPTLWPEIVNAYLADYKNHSESYNPPKAQRTSIRQEIEWLNSLHHIEVASAQRASKAGIFDNVQRSDIATAAREALKANQVKLRNGCGEFMNYVHRRNSQFPIPQAVQNSLPTTILSVNWSASFINAVITETFTDHSTSSLPPWAETLQIHANELPSVTTHDATEHTETSIRTSGDKVERFHALCATFPYSNARTIYVGDSATDLECLLAAHTGICIRDRDMGSSQQELAETCDRIGVDVRSLREKPNLDKMSNVLWWACDFAEIHRWLESIDGS